MNPTGKSRLLLAAGGGVLLLGAIAAGVIVLRGGLSGQATGLVPVGCPFESPADTPVECATLAVPAHYGDSAELIKHAPGPTLFVTTVRALARAAETDPVLVLGGEAGQAGSDLMARSWPAFETLNRGRDVIFVDQRGSGQSRPSLACPGLDPVKVNFGALTTAEAEGCAESMRSAGIDPAAISTVDSAGDLVALRKALRLKTWNVVATGTGAVLALELARQDGAGLRSLILDSPAAPKASPTDLDRLAAVQRVFRRVFADCTAQRPCSQAFPKLELVFEDLAQRLTARPLPALFTHPVSGVRTAGVLGTGELLTMLTRLVGTDAEAANVPALIWSLNELAHGRPPTTPDPVAALHAAYWRVTPIVAHGVAAVFTCREVQPWVDLEGTRGMAAMFMPFVVPQSLGLDYEAFCPSWKLPRLSENSDAQSPDESPTLILTGEYDTVTPGYQATALAATMRTVETLNFRGLGHGLLASSSCARDAVAGFLDSPGRKLDQTCASAPPIFRTTPIPVAMVAAGPVAAAEPAPAPVPAPVAVAAAPVVPVPAAAPAAQPAPQQVAAIVPPPRPLVGAQPAAVSPPPPPPPPAAPALPKVAVAECPFAVPGDARAECGTIVLPERRDQSGGKTVSIFFAITRATGSNPLADPVLVLNGGPGQPSTDLIESGWERLSDLRQTRDILYVDQRGTGYSQPGLYCRSLSPVGFWHGGLTAADAEECARPVQSAGYDLAAFNTVESAADLTALRLALGIRQWNLFGTSYGTTLAMELVRRDGAAVRSVVLNSPTTARASWLDLNRMVAIRDVYRRLFADCAADPACAATYPNLESVFLDLAKRMTDNPMPVTYQDPHSGQTVKTRMNFANLLDILTIMVGSGTAAERVPPLIWHLHRVATGKEPARPELLAWLYMPYWKTMDMLAYGLNAAIGCREVRPWVDPVKARRDGMAYQPYVMPQSMELDYDTFCPAWKLPRGPEGLRQPVISGVPVLILTGDYDTLTPTGIAETLAITLSSAQILRFHAIGHDVFSASACGRAALTRFISNPAGPVELACLQTPRVPQFVARRSQ